MAWNRRVVIEGGIGVGKSASLDILDRHASFLVFPEPVSEWTEYLTAAYTAENGGDLRQALLQLQLAVINSLLCREESIKNCLSLNDKLIAVVERSTWSSMMFTEVNAEEMGCQYANLITTLTRLLSRLEERCVRIFLTAEDGVAYSRVKQRKRPEDVHLSRAYLSEINGKFRDFAKTNGYYQLDTTFMTPEEVAAKVAEAVDVKI